MASDTMTEVLHDPRRRVVFEAVHNFRDLGGYPTAHGAHTCWNVLYRADGLHRLTDPDLVVFANLGIRTVVDLRTDLEVEQHGSFPHERMLVDFHHVAVIDATWNHEEVPDLDDVDFLVWAYRSMLSRGADRFADAMSILAEAESAAVFHCAAGKDRTGILAALVLGSVGVPDQAIVADYALTAAAMQRMQTWVRTNHPDLYARYAETPSAFLAAEPAAMQVILDDLRSQHGSVGDAARAFGLSATSLDRLTGRLLG